MTPSSFLEACRASSHAAYEQFKGLLAKLESPATRLAARQLLEQLQRSFEAEDADQFAERHSFSFEQLTTSGDEDEAGRLVLLQLPSIFTPEEWSFTFFEGLARYPTAEFQGRSVVELGCGNGWISIALAKRCLPSRITGLDINPRAVVCAKINLYLNALDGQGTPRLDHEGKSLLDRVDFQVSDLLSALRDGRAPLDRIIGCIPQVLSPDPQAALRYAPENASDEFLYSLSNYCEKQGFVEDQFGLGLIARALEEAVDLMKPSGKVLLNLGGRPGSAVLDRLFARRGFHVRKVWQTKVVQASDTDIDALVEIEKNSPHRFEFYMGLSSDEPIGAKTASAYAAEGGEIAHALSVYEGTLRSHGNVRKIMRLLRKPGYEDARSALDLSFQDDALADEKISFLSSLAENMDTPSAFPYERTEGIVDFRRRLAEFFRSYWRVPVTANSFLVTPSRADLIRNLLHLYRPRIALVDREFAKWLPARWLGAEPGDGSVTSVLEIPRRAEQTARLVRTLHPEIVVCGLADFEIRSTDSFMRLVEACAEARTRLFLDISPHFDLSSTPAGNAVLSLLSEQALPAHVSLFCGLVKNKVYADLEVCFLLSENSTLLEGLTNAAEFTYSRTPLFSQRYYDRILFDLLNFQMTGMRKERTPLRLPQKETSTYAEKGNAERENGPGLVPFAHTAVKAFQHPCIAVNSLPLTSDTARLDYGENELPAPTALHSAVFEAFARQNVQPQEREVEDEVARLLETRLGLNARVGSHLVLGGGVAPLFALLAEECAATGGVFVFPTGAYGYFNATCDFFGTETRIAETSASQSFRLTPKALQMAAAQAPGKRPWVFLNAPVVNPTGAVYAPEELADVVAMARELRSVLVIDTVFAGLEFAAAPPRFRLEEVVSKDASPHRDRNGEPNFEFVVLGGLSKEFAGGGLRFGFASTRSKFLAQLFRSGVVSPPHSTLRYAAKKVFDNLARKDVALLADLSEQRALLRERAQKLMTVLERTGWTVPNPQGGLFLVASPTAYLGKTIVLTRKDGSREEMILSATNLPQALFESENVLINNDVWTGIPGHCRFVLSTQKEAFEKACLALESFSAKFGK